VTAKRIRFLPVTIFIDLLIVVCLSKAQIKHYNMPGFICDARYDDLGKIGWDADSGEFGETILFKGLESG
jgi:hypothetical protein